MSRTAFYLFLLSFCAACASQLVVIHPKDEKGMSELGPQGSVVDGQALDVEQTEALLGRSPSTEPLQLYRTARDYGKSANPTPVRDVVCGLAGVVAVSVLWANYYPQTPGDFGAAPLYIGAGYLGFLGGSLASRLVWNLEDKEKTRTEKFERARQSFQAAHLTVPVLHSVSSNAKLPSGLKPPVLNARLQVTKTDDPKWDEDLLAAVKMGREDLRGKRGSLQAVWDGPPGPRVMEKYREDEWLLAYYEAFAAGEAVEFQRGAIEQEALRLKAGGNRSAYLYLTSAVLGGVLAASFNRGETDGNKSLATIGLGLGFGGVVAIPFDHYFNDTVAQNAARERRDTARLQAAQAFNRMLDQEE